MTLFNLSCNVTDKLTTVFHYHLPINVTYDRSLEMYVVCICHSVWTKEKKRNLIKPPVFSLNEPVNTQRSLCAEAPFTSRAGSHRGQLQRESRRWADWVEGGAGVREGGAG